MVLYVEDYLGGAAVVPDRKFTWYFGGFFPVSVKFSHRVYGFSNDYHGPFKVIVETRDGGLSRFRLLAMPFTEEALKALRWRDEG